MTTPPPALLWLSRALAGLPSALANCCASSRKTARDDSNFESGCTAAQQAGRRTSTAGSSGSDAEWIGCTPDLSAEGVSQQRARGKRQDKRPPPPARAAAPGSRRLEDGWSGPDLDLLTLSRDARTVFLSVFALGPPLAGRRRSGVGSSSPKDEDRRRGDDGSASVLPRRTAGRHGRGFMNGPRATGRPTGSSRAAEIRRDRSRSSGDRRGGSGVYRPTSIERGESPQDGRRSVLWGHSASISETRRGGGIRRESKRVLGFRQRVLAWFVPEHCSEVISDEVFSTRVM
ncbi:hypothetical protein THAOC_08802 [Thalassiosira oceanica]|uniref:Uncharacterized protein n=1 Tax=Thalassiosira oceanica TaxID=159749 RepID=K0THF1_THAOC|nr:hypothetical protein THAOC_08802 [Thalassiosira oceanica]|eukprot:EJK69902.1 hypothetical protein THAOC_08802 [Thalassiosira oceanica]